MSKECMKNKLREMILSSRDTTINVHKAIEDARHKIIKQNIYSELNANAIFEHTFPSNYALIVEKEGKYKIVCEDIYDECEFMLYLSNIYSEELFLTVGEFNAICNYIKKAVSDAFEIYPYHEETSDGEIIFDDSFMEGK